MPQATRLPRRASVSANGHLPARVPFVTDGQNPKHDRKRVRHLLAESQHDPLYGSVDVTDEQIYEPPITQEFRDWVRAK